jgi:hypothetical protein
MYKSLNNYHFVVATQNNEENFKKNSPICLFLDKTENFSNSTVLYENKTSLTKVYNSFITQENSDKKIIFVHDDVLIEDVFLFEKLDVAFEKYDIVGLAGTKKCDITKPPAWHLMSERQDHVGEVAHSKDKVYWTTVFGPTDSRALIIDGLFIAVSVKKLLDSNTRFDENFDFHHYDITFCLNANKNKLKIGVYPIKVTHFGLGDSMNTEEWMQSSLKFQKLYK